MERSEAQQRIKDLIGEINHHNHLYYDLSKSEISDKQFDLLLTELQKLETEFPDLLLPDSPSQRVGGSITKDFPTVQHEVPFLSLSNS